MNLSKKQYSYSKIQLELPDLIKGYYVRRIWGTGYFTETSGNVTDDMIKDYINHHSDIHDGKSKDKIRLDYL